MNTTQATPRPGNSPCTPVNTPCTALREYVVRNTALEATIGKNDDAQGTWHQLAPFGEFRGTTEDGTVVVQVIDRAAVDAMAADFSGELLVDFEHFSHQRDKETRAAGWINAVRIADDGLYGRIRWTNSGRSAIDGRDYRFISPEFIGTIDGGRIRPRRLDGAGLTNRPQITTIKPLLNRAADGASTRNTMNEQLLTKLRAVLGAGTDADETTLLNRLNQSFPGESTLQAIHNRLSALEGEVADGFLQGITFPTDDEKKIVRDALIANRETGKKLIGMLRQPTPQASPPPPSAVFNRETATPPSTDESLKQKATADAARATRIDNRAAEIAKTEKVSLSQAYSRAAVEIDAAK